MITDFGTPFRQRLINPPAEPVDDSVEGFTKRALEFDRELKLQRAREYLGARWRGRPDCTHRYTTSDKKVIQLKDTTT